MEGCAYGLLSMWLGNVRVRRLLPELLLATTAVGVAPATGDYINAVIPLKNPMALTAYYLGVFSLIPIIGAQ